MNETFSSSSHQPEEIENPESTLNQTTEDGPETASSKLDRSVSFATLIRHITFFTVFAVSSVMGLIYREEIMRNIGYGALPSGIWGTLFVYLLINRTGWLMGRLRETISSLAIVIGGITVLGIFTAPLGAETGETMGGRLGEILAREPFDWYRYDLVLWHQVLAWVRASVFFTAGAAAQFPREFGVTVKMIWVGILMMVSGSVALFMSAGGAAASIATKRSGSKATERATEQMVSGTAGANVGSSASVISESEVSSGNRDSSFSWDRGDEELHSDLVVGMGDTIIVGSAEHHDMFADEEDGWFDSDDIATVEMSEFDVQEDVDTDAFIAVGTSLSNADDDLSEDVSQLIDDTTDTDHATEGEVSYVSTDEETEALLDKITSGATVISAMNAFPWHLPPIAKLNSPPKGGVSTGEIKSTSNLIEETLADHNISVSVAQVQVGPTVTMYGLKPGWKISGAKSKAPDQRVRVDAILSREKDIALALSSPNIRFESVVPGSSVVGIEVPNAKPTPVNLRTVMDSPEWAEFVDESALPVPLGMGSGGNPVMADFAKMPHTLVAGATGSGKSVCMNTIITGLLLTRTPIELRMVMIDPKRVELTPYQGIPHLYTPVIVEPERAVKALKALVTEMMDRFATLEEAGVKNITAYNAKSSSKMPYLLILVDELADLMLTSSNEVEQLLVRLAQLGRATGVHLVVATQRPSVDVVTGLIKANFPSRVSFAVGSKVDSRTILDTMGADRLLGKGDMLYKPIDLSQPVRVQGAFLAEEEIGTVVDFWKQVGAPPMSQLDVDGDEVDEGFSMPGLSDDGDDVLFRQASDMAKSQKTLSTSFLQRRLRIGYPRAARLMDELEDAGIVGPGEPGKPRRVVAGS